MYDPDLLKEQVQAYDLNRELELTEEMVRYRDFYDINYSWRFENLSYNVGFLDIQEYKIYVQSYTIPSAKGTAFVCHGYYDHSALYGQVIRYFLDQHINVVLYDQPGHGLSSGDRGDIVDFKKYSSIFEGIINSFTDSLPSPFHVIGQSMGAATIMDFILKKQYTENSTPFKRVILLAPLVKLNFWECNPFFLFIAKLIRKTYADRTYSPNPENEFFSDFIRYRDPLQFDKTSLQWASAAMQWVKQFNEYPPCNVHVLVIQGKKDSVIDAPYNIEAIKQKFKARIEYYATAQHNIVNDGDLIQRKLEGTIRNLFGRGR